MKNDIIDSKTTILVIDDDHANLEMVGKFFTRKGYAILLAEDGEQGLALFHDHKPDLLLVDLMMPKVDGFKVLEEINNTSPDTPIIVISGEGEKDDVIQALRLGAWNYHLKPFENFNIILHSVEQALEKAWLIKEVRAYQKGLEKKLGTIVENFDGFIFTRDKNRKITYINPALQEYLGHDATGMACQETLLCSDLECQLCSDIFQNYEQPFKQEFQSTKDGRWYQAIVSTVLDKNGEIAERQIILYDITERKQAMLDLQEREEYLRKENIRLRSTLKDRYRFGEIIGKSTAMQEVYETILNAAASDSSVIIYGESGTGKELVAKAIHDNSARKRKRLVYVNCGAIPENLIESEFFGYKKGAFSGAIKDKFGFLDIADGGTLFLDEVGEMPINMQIKLLRALEGNGYTPVGTTEVKSPDFRIIAATHRDLKELARQGKIRQDFLYRIHIIPIEIPSLRQRKEDIPLLIEFFLNKYEKKKRPHLTPQEAKALEKYDWPGNVRELQNTINRFVTLKKLDFLGLDVMEQSRGNDPTGINIKTEGKTFNAIIEEVEQKIILEAFKKHNWHKGETAKDISIPTKTLYRKMKQYGIKRPA